MVTQITQGVKVSVQTDYQASFSSPLQSHFVFTYKIRIENKSSDVVQLLRRQWFIFDSDGSIKEVEGEGVVGNKPILNPGEVHEYVSGCNLKTEFGKMHGTYLFINVETEDPFLVSIPEFNLVVPYKLN